MIPFPEKLKALTILKQMDKQRFILYAALAAVLMMLWQAWQQQYAPDNQAITDTATTSQGPQTVPGPTTETSLPSAPENTGSQAAVPIESMESGTRVRVVTDVLDVLIDTQGGDIRSWKLRKYAISSDKPDQPFELFNENPETVYINQGGLIGKGRGLPNHKTRYRTKQTEYQMAEGSDTLSVPLFWKGPDGTQYRKTYLFARNSYKVDIEYEIVNRTNRVWEGYLYTQLLRRAKEKERGLFTLPTYIGGAIYTPEEHYEKIHFSDMAEAPLNRDVVGGWVAMMEHYFVGSLMPAPETKSRFYSNALGKDRYVIGYKELEPTVIAAGKTGKLSTSLYVGPKEQKLLEPLAEGMELTIDYGILTVLSAPLFWMLNNIHDWVGNWGAAIILLTMIIKLIFFPLSAASYKSMAHMKRVQPKIQSLKERFGDDKKRFNQAMMEIYKTEKINPLGGCLPILVQIPVFIALYWVLLESVEMRHAPFALWIQDLSSPDPYFVLPVLMGISMYAQHFLNPSPMDPLQKKIMLMMPGMFTLFFLFFPSGLVLYWVVNNVLSIAQQWQITRMINAKS